MCECGGFLMCVFSLQPLEGHVASPLLEIFVYRVLTTFSFFLVFSDIPFVLGASLCEPPVIWATLVFFSPPITWESLPDFRPVASQTLSDWTTCSRPPEWKLLRPLWARLEGARHTDKIESDPLLTDSYSHLLLSFF